MKLAHTFALALAAGSCISISWAQQAPAQQALGAYVKFNAKDKKSPLVQIKRANGKNNFVYEERHQDMQGDASKCKVFFIPTPADAALALKTYAEGDFASARKLLGDVKAKYTPWLGLPGNPSEKAAVAELECAIRQMDWEGLKGLVASFPHPDWLEAEDRVFFNVARVMSRISDDPSSLESQQKAVESLLSSGAAQALNSRTYGLLKYALGRAYAAQIPDAEVKGAISEENVPKANLAIDTLCQAAISSHGAQMEVPLDAMCRAQALLWAMPGVKEYSNRVGSRDMNRQKWTDAPIAFRDAVSLAYMIKNVFAPEGFKNELVDKAAAYYFNSTAGQE